MSTYTIPNTVITVDTETTGLWWEEGHQAWEVSYAVGEEQPTTLLLRHDPTLADDHALEINGYKHRWEPTMVATLEDLVAFQEALRGRYMLGVNVGFDRMMLTYWRVVPPVWHHRPLDLSGIAAVALGLDEPPSLHDTIQGLNELGLSLPLPDHSSYGDVIATREAYRAIRERAWE